MANEAFRLTIIGDHPEFRQHVQLAHSALKAVAEVASCPPVDVTAVLMDDFVGAVEAAWQRAGLVDERPFTLDRTGGTVSAKNIPMTPDHSKVEIVFNSQLWKAADEHPMAEARRLWVALHEFMHPVIGRLRQASGALDGVVFPSHTPSEVARSIVRTAIEEMRCDQLADSVLKNLVSVARPDGETMPLRIGMLHDLGYCQAVIEALDERVYPGWPEIVEEYQFWRVSLEEMWRGLAEGTDGIVNLLGRAQAEAMSVDYLGPLSHEAAEHPGTVLYLGPMWNRVIATANEQPLVASLDAFAAMERTLLDDGEAAILDMWRVLGVEVEELEDRSFKLWITSPTRVPRTLALKVT